MAYRPVQLRGNWTALFCHGSRNPAAPRAGGEHIYVFPNSGGYDGQSYHCVAHDPLARTETGRAVPDPSLRFPGFCCPAWHICSRSGRTQWVDAAFDFCELIFLGLGAWWLARLLEREGRDPRWAVLYVIVPSSIASIDRMLVDVAVVSLAIGFAFYLEQEETSFWKLYFVLMAAALCRETGLLLLPAYGIRLLLRRRFGRLALLVTAALPWAIWTGWTRTYIAGAAALGIEYFFYPFRGMMDAVEHPRHFAYPAAIVAVIVGLCGYNSAAFFWRSGRECAAAREKTPSTTPASSGVVSPLSCRQEYMTTRSPEPACSHLFYSSNFYATSIGRCYSSPRVSGWKSHRRQSA